MLPVLDPAVLRVLTVSSRDEASAAPMFFAAPVRWVDGEDGDLVALGVGSIDGQPRREKLATLHSQVVQSAFPGLSRQNTRNVIEPVASTAVPPLPAAVDGPGPTAAPAPIIVPVPSTAAGSSTVAATTSGPSTVPAPLTVPAPANTVPPVPNAAQLPFATGQGTAASLAAPPASSAKVPASFQPPPVPVPVPARPLTNGMGSTGPGPISLPPPPLASQMQRSGTEYFTPAVDTSELKRL